MALFREALALVERGCHIDVTAFPVDDKADDELSAPQAFAEYLRAGLPIENLTVSSDAGGSLPDFDEEGRVSTMNVGQPTALLSTLQDLLESGHSLESILPPFTSNVAKLFRLTGKGHLASGADADLVVLDDDGGITNVMAKGQWHIQQGSLKIQGTFE
jgi:beta-aspartyl-dipeptidase (metallo-type)